MTTNIETIIDELKAAQYYKFTKEEYLPKALEHSYNAIKKHMFARDFDLYDKENILASLDRRCYGADNEDLAESGVADLLDKLAYVFNVENVLLGEVVQDFTGEDYSVTINGQKYIIYTKEELKKEDSWYLSAKRTVGIINDLFKKSNSDERAYLRSGGNDGQIVLLNKRLVEIVKKYKLDTECRFEDIN